MCAMPARTLSPFVATDRALLSPPSRYSSAAPSSRTHHHNAYTQRRLPTGTYYVQNIVYDAPESPALSYSLASNDAPFIASNGHAPYPPPVPMERTNIVWGTRNPAPLQVQPSSPPPLGWLPHPPSISRLPPLIPPPPLLHKVWILDCKACGTFLTNRGMKAVLLLRPNVPLFSTDALPANCSPHLTAMCDGSQVKTEAPSLSSSSPTSPVESERVQPVGRTCECLTQTLYCHGCGKGVGYMIVTPCHRCTSSMTITNRTTNGHRFVFYSSEISPSERHYIPGEPGVMEFNTLPTSSPLAHSVPPSAYYMHSRPYTPIPTTPPRVTRSPVRGRRSSHARTPSSPRSPGSAPSDDDSPPPLLPLTPESRQRMPGASPEQCASLPTPERIEAGNVLYWHNLIKSGEIPAVREDLRARGVNKDILVKRDPDDRTVAASASDTISVCTRKAIAGR